MLKVRKLSDDKLVELRDWHETVLRRIRTVIAERQRVAPAAPGQKGGK
jgi:hypothetical protein